MSIETPKKRRTHQCLEKIFNTDNKHYEIGIDEAGRGPMFGRVYTGAVVLPKDSEDFHYEWMKDSKKFSSPKKIKEVAEYIKENAVAWSVTYEDEKSIDKINILQATFKSMHHAVHNILADGHEISCLVVDGNNFKPYAKFDNIAMKYKSVPHFCVEGGDNKYASIAAASILAKVGRDTYIEELCEQYPELVTHYNIDKNKGYGTKKHIDGIREHGITQWHRKSYGLCRNADIAVLNGYVSGHNSGHNSESDDEVSVQVT